MKSGIINVLKPSNMTSHDVVSFMRKITGIKKIGHTGTLDPNAAGVLPICIGKSTRVSEYFNNSEITKRYRGELTLGEKTDTKDKYGSSLEKKEVTLLKESEIKEKLKSFLGKIEQIPPMYSAKKINGRKLYELARKGIEVERKPRNIEIYSFDFISMTNNSILFEVECSSGTYIRVLLEDLAYSLNNLGYMSFLIRTGIGNFNIENSLTLEEIEEYSKTNGLDKLVKRSDFALEHLEKIVIKDSNYEKLINGVKLEINHESIIDKSNIRVYSRNEFIGIGSIDLDRSLLKMKKVLI